VLEAAADTSEFLDKEAGDKYFAEKQC